MTAEEIVERVRDLVSLAHAAAKSDPRWWTHREIAGLCIRAAQWVELVPRVEGGDRFAWMPVRSRCTPMPVTSSTIRRLLFVANVIQNGMMDHLRTCSDQCRAVDRGGQLVWDLESEASERFPGSAVPDPIRAEHTPCGPVEAWIARWTS